MDRPRSHQRVKPHGNDEPKILKAMKPENLTTWALDELSPQERQKIEAALKADEQLHADAESTRDFCDFLTTELSSTEDGLTDSQRTSLLPSPDKAKTVAPKHNATPWWRRPGTATLAAAAVVTLMGGLSVMQEGVLSDTARGIESKRESDHASSERLDRSDATRPLKDAQLPDGSQSASINEMFALSLETEPEVVGIDGFINYGNGISNGSKGTAAPQLDVNQLSMLGESPPNTGSYAVDTPMPAPPGQSVFGSSQNRFGFASGGNVDRSVSVDLNAPVASADPSLAEPPVVGMLARGNQEISASTRQSSAAPSNGTRPGIATTKPQASAAAPPTTTVLSSILVETGAEAKTTGTPAQPMALGDVAEEAIAFTNGRDLQEYDDVEMQIQLPAIAAKEADDLLRLRKEKLSDLRLTEPAPAPPAKPRNETYTPIHENPFMSVTQAPLSTFSIDVDTASYANVRRFLNDGQRPPPDAVRIEELVNYFRYDYEQPEGDAPFSVNVDIAEAPWNPTHRLARIGLMGREILDDRKPGNFVFLVDVSGSMNSADKLELVQKSLRLLTRQLGDADRVAIVTYAGSSGLALESTSGADKPKITEAIDRMRSGGSTHGSAGIRLAYEQAASNFIKDGVNRVILCTDGDFNVGISDPDELESVIAQKAKSGVFLSVLGFGTGNLKDRTMETLADKGNGNYAYIDSLSEARKVLVEQMNATFVTIAKDVKIQVEFNPAQVQSYRLIGYENRMLAKEDFNDDTKDAGEIGAGHTVTALYELVPVGAMLPDGRPIVDELKYQVPAAPAVKPSAAPKSSETLTIKLRHKQPNGEKSQLMEVPVTDEEKTMNASPKDFQFASAVAGFGLLLRNSAHRGELTWDMVRKLAQKGKGPDKLGYRGEFLQLIDKAQGATER